MDRAVKGSWIALGLMAALALPAYAFASGAQDLGSSQPAGIDLSANPQFHVYQWQRDGVTFIQVNDVYGNIDFAVATGGGQVLVLPIGHPELVNVLAGSTAGSGSVVYAGSTATISYNAGSFSIMPATSSPTNTTTQPQVTTQSAALCQNPADCSQAVASPTH